MSNVCHFPSVRRLSLSANSERFAQQSTPKGPTGEGQMSQRKQHRPQVLRYRHECELICFDLLHDFCDAIEIYLSRSFEAIKSCASIIYLS